MNEFDKQYKELGFDPHDVLKSGYELTRLMSRDNRIKWIHSSWHYDDVRSCAKDRCGFVRELTNAECEKVFDRILKNHDANVGINWDVIEYWIDELFDKTITIQCGCRHSYDFKYIEEKPDEIPEHIQDYKIDDCPNCQDERE